jgi:hypothetical protein
MAEHPIEPLPVVHLIEEYLSHELAQCQQFENRTPLDDSGIWSLHRLAAEIYGLGFNDGEWVEAERSRQRARR